MKHRHRNRGIGRYASELNAIDILESAAARMLLEGALEMRDKIAAKADSPLVDRWVVYFLQLTNSAAYLRDRERYTRIRSAAPFVEIAERKEAITDAVI